MSFQNLGLSAALLQAVSEKGYTTPSPIQIKSIPPILQGKDVLASAQTGTGKTAGFTLPMLQILSESRQNGVRAVRALILTPTRELAAQVQASVIDYGAFLDIRSAVIFGGVNQKPQVNLLRKGVDVLVATPGRLLDLHNQGLVSLKNVQFFVLDEADRMLDMGFHRDIERVMKLIPKQRQNLMFSATFSPDIKKLANGILNNPVLVEATPENTTVDAISQKVYRVPKSKKTALIIKLISEGNWKQVLVFARTKHGANKLCEKMLSANINARAIHGNKSQGARTQALAGFKDGSIAVLVATDIAARGLDIPLLPHVVNFEMPNVSEDYVHRIGRTGRAGASGEAISLVSNDEMAFLKDIEKLVGIKIPVEEMEGFEIDPNESFEPFRQGQNNAPRPRRVATPRTPSRSSSAPKQRNGGKPFSGGRKNNHRAHSN